LDQTPMGDKTFVKPFALYSLPAHTNWDFTYY
jgi:hypothetical protein